MKRLKISKELIPECVTVPGCCCCMPLLHNHLMDSCSWVRKTTLLAACKGGCICTLLTPPKSATVVYITALSKNASSLGRRSSTVRSCRCFCGVESSQTPMEVWCGWILPVSLSHSTWCCEHLDVLMIDRIKTSSSYLQTLWQTLFMTYPLISIQVVVHPELLTLLDLVGKVGLLY